MVYLFLASRADVDGVALLQGQWTQERGLDWALRPSLVSIALTLSTME